MIKVTARENETELEMYGEGADIAKELRRIVRHVSGQLLKITHPGKMKPAAELLATGMATAVKEAYDEVRKGASP